MNLIKIAKLATFSATFLFAGFLFLGQAEAIENINMQVTPYEAPYGTSSVTLSGGFEVPSWIPFCGWAGGEGNGSLTYGLFPRQINNDFRYRVLNSNTGQEVHEGRYFTGPGPGGAGYDYDIFFYGNTLISCPTNYQGQDPEEAGFGVNKYAFKSAGIQIPIPNNLTPGQYEVALSYTASPDGSCDTEYWDGPEMEDPPCNDYEISGNDDPGLVFYITAAPPGTVSVYSNRNTCFDVSGPSNPAPTCMSTAPDTLQYSNMTEGQYSITADDISCYDKTIQSTPQTLNSGSSITFNIIYSANGSCGQPDPGTINIVSNLSTSWEVWGAASYSDSGTSMTYENAPLGSYDFSAESKSGYNLNINIDPANGQLIEGGSITVTITYTAVGSSCTDNSTVTLIDPLPASLDPGQTYQFTVEVTNTGNNWWYHGSAHQLHQKNTSFNINNGGNPWGHHGSSVHSTAYLGYVDPREITFTLVAPTTPDTYYLPLQMSHRAGWNDRDDVGVECGPTAVENTWFGQVLTVPFTVGTGEPPVVNTINFSITYTPATLVAPTGVSVSHACVGATPTMTINWSHTLNGSEDGFYVYRSTNDTDWEAVSGLLGTGIRTFENVAPTINTRYYYRVSSHRTLDIEPREAFSASDDAMNNACVGDLSQSTMTLTHVNGAPFTGATVIEKDDVLRYRILIINQGPASVQIQRICGNPGSNLINPTNFVVPQETINAGASNGGMQINNGECVSLGNEGLRFSLSGTKDVDNNWIMDYDTVYSSASEDPQEVLANCGKIYYSDITAKTKTVCADNILVNTSIAAPPTFREVAP